jgi:hypothetical protein
MFTTHIVKRTLENDKYKMDTNLLKLCGMKKRHGGHRKFFIASVVLEP